MRLILFVSFALVVACSTPHAAPAAQHPAVTGAACDHTQNVYPCGHDVACNPACDVGETCDVTDVCGTVCGNGVVVCDPGMVCTMAADCVPPCMVGGAPKFVSGSNCQSMGLVAVDPQTCVVPCWYFACVALGGSC